MKAMLSVRALLVLATATSLAPTALAGPMTPPPGAPIATMKPLSDVEPRIAINATNTPGDNDVTPSMFRITAPGSYYLTGDIVGVSGRNGIEIMAHGVTIDLNGFQMSGVAGSLTAIRSTVSSVRNVTIRNGSIRDWDGSGIDLSTSPTIGAVISEVQVSDCQYAGIYAGTGAMVRECAASFNGTNGITVGTNGVVDRCVSFENGLIGIQIGLCASVSDSVVRENGTDGIYAMGSSSITGCTVTSSGANGINAVAGNRIIGNLVAYTASGSGIRLTGARNHVESNNVFSNVVGYDIEAGGNFLARNIASANTTNWSVLSGNTCYVVSTTKNATFSGNSGGTPPGSADPSANFTY